MESRVPFDVWEEVFRRCLPLDEFIQPSAFTAPLLLCQVDKAWRNRAVSMPILWASLSIKISRRGCIPRIDLISTWLNRAASHPLYLALTLDRRPGVRAFINSDEALCSLFPFFPSWSKVVINVGPFLNLQSFLFLSTRNVTAPFFESLNIFLPTTFEEASEKLGLLCGRSPRLRHLELSTELPGNYIENIKVPFENLTSLHIRTFVTPDNCRDTMEQCPNLVEIIFDDISGSLRTRSGPPIVLPDLKLFSISSSTKQMDSFLDSFTFPSLLDISLGINYPFPAHNFINLLHRSQCRLCALRLSLVDMDESYLIECLRACSTTLETFEIKNPDQPCVGSLLLEKLTMGKSAGLCPQLENITLGYNSISSSDGMLATMLKSRFTAPDLHLNYANIVLRAGYHLEDSSQFREFIRYGWKIVYDTY